MSVEVGNPILRRYSSFITEFMKSQIGADEFYVPALADVVNNNPELLDIFTFAYDSTYPSTGSLGDVDMLTKLHQGFCMRGSFYAMNRKTGDFNLYSADPSILAELGVKTFNTKKLYELNAKGTVYAFRIDTVYNDVFGATKSSKAVNLTSSRLLHVDDYIFVPYLSIDRLIALINAYLHAGRVLEITTTSGRTQKTRIVTLNPKVLEDYNGWVPLSRTLDLRLTGRVYLPVVGAPVMSSGITALGLERIDAIKTVRRNELNLEKVDASIEYLVSTEIFSIFVNLVMESEPHKERLFSYLKECGSRIRLDSSRLEYIRAIRDLPSDARDTLFNSLPDELIAYHSKMLSSVFTCFEPVEVPSTSEELRSLLKIGVYHIVMLTDKGSFSSFFATNNSSILEVAYGKNYVARWESAKYRSMTLYRLLKMGCPLAEAVRRSGTGENFETIEDALDALESENFDSSSFEPSLMPNEPVLSRTLFRSKSEGSFYRTLTPSKIFKITRVG